MRKALFLVLSLSVALASSCSAEAQICGRMETLCGTTREDCKGLVKSVQADFGDEGVQGVKACFSDAKSCNEATGCVMGKGLKSLTDSMGDFLKGLGEGLKGEKK